MSKEAFMDLIYRALMQSALGGHQVEVHGLEGVSVCCMTPKTATLFLNFPSGQHLECALNGETFSDLAYDAAALLGLA